MDKVHVDHFFSDVQFAFIISFDSKVTITSPKKVEDPLKTMSKITGELFAE